MFCYIKLRRHPLLHLAMLCYSKCEPGFVWQRVKYIRCDWQEMIYSASMIHSMQGYAKFSFTRKALLWVNYSAVNPYRWYCEYVNPYIIYPQKPLRKCKWPSTFTEMTAHFMCGLTSDLLICKHRVRSYVTLNVLTETMRPGVIKQHTIRTRVLPYLAYMLYIYSPTP